MKEPGQVELIAELLELLTHDLRNPLSAVHSNLSYLASTLSEREVDAQEALEDAVISSEGLSHLIDNIEVLAQVIRPRKNVDLGSAGVGSIVKNATERCFGLAKSHEVTLEIGPELSRSNVAVRCHRDRLSSSLECLMRNAIQHSPPGGKVAISVVSVASSPESPKCAIRICDEGHPLGDEYRESAFTLKGQLSAKGNAGGRYSRGLGLFCAKSYAETAGAEICVERASAPFSNVFLLQVPVVS